MVITIIIIASVALVVAIGVIIYILKSRSRRNKQNYTTLSVLAGKPYDETVGSGRLNMLYEQEKTFNTIIFDAQPNQTGCASGYTLVNIVTGEIYRGSLASISVVGRSLDDKQGGIEIQDKKLSRQHCRFYCSGSGVVIEDLNSTNHTFLNGQLLTAPSWIQPGDIVAIGNAEYVFQYER